MRKLGKKVGKQLKKGAAYGGAGGEAALTLGTKKAFKRKQAKQNPSTAASADGGAAAAKTDMGMKAVINRYGSGGSAKGGSSCKC